MRRFLVNAPGRRSQPGHEALWVPSLSAESLSARWGLNPRRPLPANAGSWALIAAGSVWRRREWRSRGVEGCADAPRPRPLLVGSRRCGDVSSGAALPHGVPNESRIYELFEAN